MLNLVFFKELKLFRASIIKLSFLVKIIFDEPLPNNIKYKLEWINSILKILSKWAKLTFWITSPTKSSNKSIVFLPDLLKSVDKKQQEYLLSEEKSKYSRSSLLNSMIIESFSCEKQEIISSPSSSLNSFSNLMSE